MSLIDTTRDTPALPESDVSLTGASGDGNSPSKADLKRGYSECSEADHYQRERAALGSDYLEPKGGFLGRAKGWER